MSLVNYCVSHPLTNDQRTALAKLDDFMASRASIFFLKGYAGTGKTTLLAWLVDYLKEQQKKPLLMAPTGRAAKILRDKVGEGVTIHKGIYNFEKIECLKAESSDDAEQSFHYFFPILTNNSSQQIIIVDEASMVSNKLAKHELFTFGTGILLADLLTYASSTTTKNKIIFVGDPAQLPPVNDNKSWALDADYFTALGITWQSTELTEIVRQGANLITTNAKMLRNAIESSVTKELRFEYDTECFLKLPPEDVVDTYTSLFPQPELGSGVVITYSNAQSYHNNVAIRKSLFPQNPTITEGDILIINNNNYKTYNAVLLNGDFAKVVWVDTELVGQHASIYCDNGGVRVKQKISFSFRKVRIRLSHSEDEVECFIIDNHLHRFEKQLSVCELKALYVNFIIRFREEQTKRQQCGLVPYQVGSEQFKQALLADPFFNAVHVKFGYSITCHKAQGGEWEKVLVDYAGRVGLDNDCLRWCYTATTRAERQLYAVNPPNIGKLPRFKLTPLTSIGKVPAHALALDDVPLSPFHSATVHRCKSLLYWNIVERIVPYGLELVNIESFDFMERYTLRLDEQLLRLEGYHDGAGIFEKSFNVVDDVLTPEQKNEIKNIFNAPLVWDFKIKYEPTEGFLSELFGVMQSFCAECGISISNIVQSDNYVNYYLITNAKCAYIQFYFNKNGELTSANPKSLLGESDSKFKLLLEKLQHHAS